MASGVNVKMGVTGIYQFKRDIGTAKESIKTLTAALELNEKQFKATGDKEIYLRDRAELLNTKLKTQKSVVNQARQALEKMEKDGVSKADKSFQSMQQTMLKAQADIVDTQNELNSLSASEVAVTDDTRDMNTEMKKIGKGVGWDNVAKGISKINDGLEKAAKQAIRLGKALLNNVLGAGSWADELQTTAAKFEISPEDLQRMKKTAEIIDTDAEAILEAQQKMRKSAASTGGKKTIEETLGISLNGTNPEDLFWEVGEALLGMSDAFDKESAAQKIFGRGWRELMPLFQAGRETYDKTNQSWNVLSQDQLDSLQKMDDEYKKLQGEFDTMKMSILSEFAEPMAEIMAIVNEEMKKFSDYLSSEEGQEMLGKVVDAIKGMLEWIVKNQDSVKNALIAIGGAIATMKLAEAASNIGRLVSGFKTLWGGANNPLPAMPSGAATGGASSAASAAAGGGMKAALSGAWQAAGGASALTPMLVALAAVAPALIANQKDYERMETDRARRMEIATSGSDTANRFLAQAADVLGYQRNASGGIDRNALGAAQLGNFAGIEALLMGMGDRSDLEKAQLYNMLKGSTANGSATWDELQRLWGGEAMDMGRLTEILYSVTDAYETMLTKTEENTRTEEKADKSAAEAVKQMPSEVESAIRSGMKDIKIYLDGNEITAVVSTRIAADIEARVNP